MEINQKKLAELRARRTQLVEQFVAIDEENRIISLEELKEIQKELNLIQFKLNVIYEFTS